MKHPYLVMAHAGGKGHGRENSIEALKACLSYKPDLIELDVRRSGDDILFCYHGFPVVPFYFLAYFLRFLRFSFIRKFLRVNTLREIFSSLKKPTGFYLDFKDTSISAKEIDSVCRDFSHKVWIASFSIKALKKWRTELGGKYIYIFNFSFFNFKKGLRRAADAGIQGFKLLPWQLCEKNVGAMKKYGMRHIIHAMYMRRATFKKLVERFGTLWICFDDFRKPEKFVRM